MRGYECHFYCLNEHGERVPVMYNACWWSVSNNLNTDIYIQEHAQKETSKYTDELLGIINEITPCKMDQKVIKFRTLDKYDPSLIILNFVRNLWHEPIPGYTNKFFDSLQLSKLRYKDPLARLTWANMAACACYKSATCCKGHSNVHKNLTVRETSDFLKWDWACDLLYNVATTHNFLTNKNVA